MRLLADQRGGVGILVAGMLMIAAVSFLLSYNLFVSQSLFARSALLKATLAAAKAGAHQIDVSQAESGGQSFINQAALEQKVRATFDANLPPVFLPGSPHNGYARVLEVRIDNRGVAVRAECGLTISTSLGPKPSRFETTCVAVPRSLRG